MGSLGITIMVAAGFVVLLAAACHVYGEWVYGLSSADRRKARELRNIALAIGGLLVLIAILVSREL